MHGGFAGASDAEPSGCIYNGVRYPTGHTFGACHECACAEDSAIVCNPIVCLSDAGSTGNGAGGATAAGAANGGTLGTSAGSSGVAGAPAPPAGAGGADSPTCDYVKVGTFCIVGTPSGDGQDFMPGMPLVISRQLGGCHSSSCTAVSDASCNAIGSDGKYWVSGNVCVLTQGDACTEDCSGGALPLCDLGPLQAGQYAIGLGGVAAPTLTFKVPSHVKNADLCVSTGAP
jgi:hypothetical protein